MNVLANHTAVKKLGHWTDSREIEVRSHRGYTVLDLRAIPEGDVEIRVDMQRSALKLLVPADTVIDQWDLRMVGRGKVKDAEGSLPHTGRKVRLVGEIRHGEVRVRRGGVAVLHSLFTKEFLLDALRAHREGGRPTVHDPANEFPEER